LTSPPIDRRGRKSAMLLSKASNKGAVFPALSNPTKVEDVELLIGMERE
jgi:hypothetical protein